jgi:flagellar export protein FliJ
MSMRAFRFRAEVALQLRRREHEQALVVLAKAQDAHTVAARALETAEQSVHDADAELAKALTNPAPLRPPGWYRSWRVRCVADVTRARQHLSERRAAVQDATKTVAETFKRVRALERLREKAVAAWQLDAHREEQKSMDALAASKFVRKEAW